MTIAPAKLVIYTDGGARGNPGPAGIGVVISDDQGNLVTEFGETIGETTNNVAEYTALIRALEVASDMGADEVSLFLDSELVVKQVRGEYRVKNQGLKELHLAVMKLLRPYKKALITHIPREQNKEADRLANEAMDGASGDEPRAEPESVPGQGHLF